MLAQVHVIASNTTGVLYTVDATGAYRSSVDLAFDGSGGGAPNNTMTFRICDASPTGRVTALTLRGSGVAEVSRALKVVGNAGFFNATPVAKPTVSGSRSGTALASLLGALATLGLISDTTTA